MFVFTPFALCFVTLCGIFMWFPELTYWQDAAVPVPCFLLFLCFKKATQEIFSESDETSLKTPIFPGRRTRTKREPERGQRLATPWGSTASPWPRPPVVRSPWSTPDDAPSPIRSLPTENPKSIGVFPRTVPQRRRRRRQILGKCPQSHLYWSPSPSPPAPSTSPPSPSPLLSPMMRRE
jgi:hypothetical protein